MTTPDLSREVGVDQTRAVDEQVDVVILVVHREAKGVGHGAGTVSQRSISVGVVLVANFDQAGFRVEHLRGIARTVSQIVARGALLYERERPPLPLSSRGRPSSSGPQR